MVIREDDNAFRSWPRDDFSLESGDHLDDANRMRPRMRPLGLGERHEEKVVKGVGYQIRSPFFATLENFTLLANIPERARSYRCHHPNTQRLRIKHPSSLGVDLGTPGHSHVIGVVQNVSREQISTTWELLLCPGPFPVGDALLQGLGLDQLIDIALVEVVEHGSLEVRIPFSARLARIVLDFPRRPIVASPGGRDRYKGSVSRESGELVVSEECTPESLDYGLTRLRFD